MGSLKRKFERKNAQKNKKENKKKIAQQLAMFEKLSDKCVSCGIPFDKKSREDAKTWRVVVKNENVFLFCPSCVKNFVKEAELQKNESL